jgi:hypothetical protein
MKKMDTKAKKAGMEHKSNLFAIQKEEMRSITKVCITNSLFLLKVSLHIEQKGNGDNEDGNKSDKIEVSFDFETHKQFCSIKIN